MKRRTDLLLAAAAALTAAACIPAWYVDVRLLLVLPGICCFFLQLIICRQTRLLVPRLLLLGLDGFIALLGWGILMTAVGWDGLLGGILLLCSISPAVGILLAWGGYALFCRYFSPKEAPHG